ncbi:outer-membrane receptor for ferric coprogen and ferric-rhodotorulic acid [Caldimonas brevitalea]|uniref:Outer-membrane receptor for ferric coprogen and ferric-rhodotorulic acid n=1 Tax=Caldimonas brevitalea TaxID=413882 RepID=A0A0G3BT91_9BURK|nr:outer-membrane receptor for ferric coprogen and ferric-rhodotorulic acid [Caldimonas brevitalea]
MLTLQAGASAQSVRADEAATASLPAVRVGGKRSDESSEHTDRYGSTATTAGSKTPVKPRELPQSVTVITRQRIEDQNLVSLEDAMRKTPGALVLNNDPGRGSVFVRGFELDTYLVDGLPAPLSSIYGTQPDLALFDRVEVLRGPSGLYAGTGEPGGTVNLARKRALARFGGSASLSYGSWHNRRVEADVTGALDAAGRVRGRVVVAEQARDSWTDVTDSQQRVAYGTLEFDLAPATTLSLALTRQERETTPFNGLPTEANGRLADVRRSTFIGADWNRFDSDATEAYAELEHRFDDGGHARVSMRHADRNVDFTYAYAGSPIGPSGSVAQLAVIGRRLWERSLAVDAHVARPFDLFGRRHEWVAGVDHRRYDQKTHANGNTNIAGPFPLVGFDPDIVEPVVPLTQRTRVEPEQTGLYGQLRLKPRADLSVIMGSRVSRYKSETTQLATGVVSARTQVDSEWTPYAGLVYDLTPHWSFYASATDVFQPQTATGPNGEVLDPREGRQFETGLKGEWFDGRLNVSAALFRLRDDKRAVAVQGTSFSTASGEVQVQGLELEASGTVRPGWEVAGGYAYTETEHLDGSPTQVGQVFSTWTPRHTLTLWTRYRPTDARLQGLQVGGGVRAVSDYHSQSGALRIEQGGHAVFDAQVGYRWPTGLELALTVQNLFDRRYYARVGGTSVFNYYGEPRSALLKATYRF